MTSTPNTSPASERGPEMVDIVADALERVALENQHLMKSGRRARVLTLILARAAIAAMREPTNSMIVQGTEGGGGEGLRIWQAMIDEALR